ncbi:multidrug effflux MFS transporter [Umezawaea tangerina]|uniref:DHA1 family bicyclomycin/chloramphenicol resistance-like MFS transporter n=1 Tax=Umezawaea tangerina TaxID=84725 RepID=A0A2T0S6W9_9PSEU|nr:multidrug effflux MFS transporter [Umezawaea tangerina]PRY29168.1 DHA1 family bicyclomycin/chloramphenicol resistance-like MFS transporter [Umezawaea tangerina]
MTTATLGPSRLKLVGLLGALCTLGPLSVDMYLPAFPSMARELGTTAPQIQLSLTTFIIGLALGQLVVGPISDAVGRRKPLLIGLSAYVLFSLMAAIAPTALALAGIRLAQAFGVAAGFVVATAVARDMFSGMAMAKFMSMLMLVNGLGPVIAPVLGGQVLRLTSWRGTFLVLALIGTVLLVVLAMALPETHPEEKRAPANLKGTLRTFGGLLSDRFFVGYALAASFALGSLFAYVSGASFVLQNVFGLTPQQFSLVFGLNSFGILLAGSLNTWLTGRITPRVLLTAGLVMATAGGLGLLTAGLLGGNLLAFLPPLFLLTTSVGVLLPNAATLAMNRHPESAGSASALLGVLQFLAGGLVAPVVGAAGTSSVIPMATVMFGLTVAATLAFTVLTRGDKGITKDTDTIPEAAVEVAPH